MSCNHDCKNCKVKSGCSEKTFYKTDFKIKKVIAIMSGKGGVGKSSVTSLLASLISKRGKKVGIIDADLTGPSIAQAFNLHERLKGDGKYIYPAISKDGVKVVSVNLLIENETDPVVWRGPVLSGALKQFYSEVYWDELDYLFIDLPPGTSDIQLTILNNIPLDGVFVVTTPQDLVTMVVTKAINLINKCNVKILGIIENMAYLVCPCCNREILLYGESKLNDICNIHNTNAICSLPIDKDLASMIDEGKIEDYYTNLLDYAIEVLENL